MSHSTPAAVADGPILDVSVVIVTYNVRAFLEQALRSVSRASERLNVETFVVDNASVDGTVEMVRERFPDVHVITNEDNVGFGKANNQAIRQARGRYLFILNPDTVVQEDTLRALVAFLDARPDCGAAGPSILTPDGTFAPESRRAFPTPEVAFYRISGLSRLFPRHPRLGRYNMTYLPRDQPAEVDALSGSCMMVRRRALYLHRSRADEPLLDPPAEPPPNEPPDPSSTVHGGGAGLFDPAFFMYGEDLDWCYRIQQAGWTICFTPDTHIIHYKGESTKKGELRYVRVFYGAMLLFAEKHAGDEKLGGGALHTALRLAIFGRAAVSVASQWMRRMLPLLLDLVGACVAFVGAGWLRVGAFDRLVGRFLWVALFFGCATVVGTLLAGGYRMGLRGLRLRPPLVGAATGFGATAIASFFAPQIGFSRWIVVVGALLTLVWVMGWRIVLRRRRTGGRRALYVGPRKEADALAERLAMLPNPPFALVGFAFDQPGRGQTRYLGPLRGLRDLVRLREVDQLVFSPDALPTYDVLGWMQSLSDLPVQFRMLAPHGGYVIGKSTVDSLDLVEADQIVGEGRGTFRRRVLDVTAGIGLLLIAPFASFVGSDRLRDAIRQAPSLIGGSRALVGYDPDQPYRPPGAWGLRSGVAPIPVAPEQTPEEAHGLYAQHQNARIDWRLFRRWLRQG